MILRNLLLSLLGVVVICGSAAAKPSLVGEPVQITNVPQQRYPNAFRPRVATLDDGRFVVVWSQGANGSRAIYGHIYNEDASEAGPQFKVSSSIYGLLPNVAALANGGFVVVWKTPVGEPRDTDYSIFAQRYSADGIPVGKTARVTEAADVVDSRPEVAALQSGGFVIAWSHSAGRILTKLYDKGGRANGPAKLETAGASCPVLVSRPEGGFVVGFNTSSLHLRQMSDEGKLIKNVTTLVRDCAKIAALSGERLVVTWQVLTHWQENRIEDYQPWPTVKALTQVYDASYTPLARAQTVYRYEPGDSYFPHVSANIPDAVPGLDDHFVLFWRSSSDYTHYPSITFAYPEVRSYGRKGLPRGYSVHIGPSSRIREDALSPLKNGNFVSVSTGLDGIFAQIYAP